MKEEEEKKWVKEEREGDVMSELGEGRKRKKNMDEEGERKGMREIVMRKG